MRIVSQRLFGFILMFCSPCLLGQSTEQTDTAATRAWRQFAGQVEQAGVDILNSYPQPSPLDRAEGLRYLLQQLSSSIQQELIAQPGQIPLLRIGASTINKWGLDGADAKYQGARISGRGSYRLYGTLGSARLFAVQLTRMAGRYATYGALSGDRLGADKEGRFEVLISPEKPEHWQGAWLALTPETDNVLIREYFSDWENESPGTYYLERLDHQPAVPAVSSADMASLLNNSVARFRVRAVQWQGLVNQARKHLVNKVHMQTASAQGLPSNAYGSSWFKLGPDQALLIELEAPDALLWSVQLGNIWWESLDYINHTSSYNSSQAVASSDGKYRFVLALQDPGVPNWLDPTGHSEGALLVRMQGATSTLVNPVVALLDVDELARHLPDDTPGVSRAERQQQIIVRRRHAAIRWAP